MFDFHLTFRNAYYCTFVTISCSIELSNSYFFFHFHNNEWDHSIFITLLLLLFLLLSVNPLFWVDCDIHKFVSFWCCELLYFFSPHFPSFVRYLLKCEELLSFKRLLVIAMDISSSSSLVFWLFIFICCAVCIALHLLWLDFQHSPRPVCAMATITNERIILYTNSVFHHFAGDIFRMVDSFNRDAYMSLSILFFKFYLNFSCVCVLWTFYHGCKEAALLQHWQYLHIHCDNLVCLCDFLVSLDVISRLLFELKTMTWKIFLWKVETNNNKKLQHAPYSTWNIKWNNDVIFNRFIKYGKIKWKKKAKSFSFCLLPDSLCQ